MLTLIEKHSAELDLLELNNIEELENFRIQYLSKKGIIAQLFDSFKTVPNQEKKETGARLNILKNQANEKYFFSKIVFLKQSVNSRVISVSRLTQYPLEAGILYH